jgi:hypothetical protein
MSRMPRGPCAHADVAPDVSKEGSVHAPTRSGIVRQEDHRDDGGHRQHHDRRGDIQRLGLVRSRRRRDAVGRGQDECLHQKLGSRSAPGQREMRSRWPWPMRAGTHRGSRAALPWSRVGTTRVRPLPYVGPRGDPPWSACGPTPVRVGTHPGPRVSLPRSTSGPTPAPVVTYPAPREYSPTLARESPGDRSPFASLGPRSPARPAHRRRPIFKIDIPRWQDLVVCSQWVFERHGADGPRGGS